MRSEVARHLNPVADRRVATMLGLGFSSGLPLLLVYATQSAWLSDADIPITTIGALSELTLAYKLKFLWAPFLDRYDPPLIGRWLERRRGWMIVSQALVVLALVGVALGDPAHGLAWTIVFSLALGFAGATQDVMIDGWRIAVAPEKKAVMASWAEIGWRVGNLAGGAGALMLADRIGWHGAYLCMAVLMAPGMVAALVAPMPESDRTAAAERARSRARPRQAAPPPAPAPARGWPALVAAVIAARAAWVEHVIVPIWRPIKDLAVRLGPMALPVLLLVAGFRMPGYVSSVMEVPLFKHLHYSNTDIATVTKVFGFWVALGATFLGGWLVPRIGMMASLLVGTVAGSASHLALAWFAAHGDHGGGEFWTFAVAVSIDSFAYALASVILITYMSTLCANDMAVSQFALLTALVALPGSLLAVVSGFLVERLGYARFFVTTSLVGVPVALLCLWVWHKMARPRAAEAV